MTVRRAVAGEEDLALSFYHELIDLMQGREYCPYWTKGVYPTIEDMRSAIAEGDLFLDLEGGKVVGAFILNHAQGKGYDRVQWQAEAGPDKAAVLHLLAVHPDCQGHGLGKQLLGQAVEVCRERGDRAIRLDTLTWNLPGRRLYEDFGFQFRGDQELTYPTTGTVPFCMYELEVPSDGEDGDDEYRRAVESIPPGRYRHFKGNEYQVLHVARHSETGEPMVVYRALYGEFDLWVRPARMWNERVTRDGETFTRFERVEE